MAIRGRPMRPKDVRKCVEIVAAHPTLGPRYGPAISSLGTAWSRLIGRDGFAGRVFEESQGSQSRIVAVGTSFFVNDSFLAEIKEPPHRWVAPQIIGRVGGPACPVLTDKQVRTANTGAGLNLLVLEGALTVRDMGRPEVISVFFAEFIAIHRGYRLKELITQGTSADIMEAQLHSGGYLLDSDGQYSRAPHAPLDVVLKQPHFIGVSRELALQQFGTWISNLFIHDLPKFKFRRSEQRLLLAALDGGTDAEVSRDLAVSVSAVKKTWRGIYDRVARLDPLLVPDADAHLENGNSERGRAKKQRLLAYLREHPEEMRPNGSL